MNRTKKLSIINGESNLQKRLKLLVDHDFLAEASKLIWDLVHANTAMFHFDWHDTQFCRPLPRVTEDGTGVYVIVTSSKNLDYHPSQIKEDGWHIIFELGWERKTLQWNIDQTRQLVRTILAQAYVRPLSQWSFKQAEGSARASRQILEKSERMAREIAALHLVYQLRQADFGHIENYLSDIKEFPFGHGKGKKPFDDNDVVNWIADQLIELGWSKNQIRKEFLEWIRLKTGTWPQSLLAVANANIFAPDDQSRAIAVRHWLHQSFEFWLDMMYQRSDGEKQAETFRLLYAIAQFEPMQSRLLSTHLIECAVSGKFHAVRVFVERFRTILRLDPFEEIVLAAMHKAAAEGKYGIAVGMAKHSELPPDPLWVDAVKIRELSIELK